MDSTQLVNGTPAFNELIVVKQLPIIEERLKQIKGQIEEKVFVAQSMVCTEDTVKQVKAIRAELNRDFKGLEEQRKEVKDKVLAPYQAFEAVYKECVTDVFAPADSQLKAKISEVEDGVKEQKRQEVAGYFQEYAESRNIDFLSFDEAGIEVTLSASLKSLKARAAAVIDKVADDLALIDAQENAAEILLEYHKTLNVAQAINTVAARYRAIEDEESRMQRAKEKEQAQRDAAAKTDKAIQQQPVSAPVQLPKPEQAQEEAQEKPPVTKEYCVSFKVYGTLEQLKALKAFLVEGGYRYEQC